jgi:hypothetical protein
LTANLAAALSMQGRAVGVLDADIHGASAAAMLGARGQQVAIGPDGARPAIGVADVRVMSMDLFLTGDDTHVTLVQMRQQTVNQVRGILNAYRVPAPRGVLYTKPSRTRLAAVRLPVPELQGAFEALLAVLESLQGQIDALNRRVRRLPREEPDVALLAAELPGIGAQSAATLLAELGDPKRFTGARAVAAYAGLVPRVYQSADKAHHGRMTKQGNPELRWILSQWAVRLMKDDPDVRAWAERLRRRVHKNKARMALARRLLVGVWILQTRGEAFDLRRCLGSA